MNRLKLFLLRSPVFGAILHTCSKLHFHRWGTEVWRWVNNCMPTCIVTNPTLHKACMCTRYYEAWHLTWWPSVKICSSHSKMPLLYASAIMAPSCDSI